MTIFSEILHQYYILLQIFFTSHERLYWLYLLTYIIIALGIYWLLHKKITGFFRFLFPQEIYTHQSTKIDIYILVLQPIFIVTLIVPMGFLVTVASAMLIESGLNMIAVSPHLTIDNNAYIIYSIIWIIFYDFGQYISHYWQHKIPVLWEFHKIHHSAEVLNPVTAYRFHPIDYCFTTIIGGMCVGVVMALFFWIYGQELTVISVFEMHIIVFLFYLIGYNFRHSHIKLCYPRWLQYILVCPSQHQIHHSIEEKHWDKNIGYIFAFWDYIFGTLYIAKSDDVYHYGLSTKPDLTYRSLFNVYVQPFKNIKEMLKK